jgi:hypothetical protein
MTKCLICENELTMTSCRCDACHTDYSGSFILPRLARLGREEQHLAEALILHGGNLKEMAEDINISYPTLKKRLKELSNSLAQKKQQDEMRIEEILKEIELGKIGAEEGIKLIREINGEL